MITMDKKYRTASGLDVEILKTNCNNKYHPVIGIVIKPGDDDRPHTWTAEGKFYGGVPSEPHEYDLVEVNPYEGFKIDEPVMVCQLLGLHWTKGHFAGLSDDGSPMTFADGRTSWSNINGGLEPYVWVYCRRPTADELKEMQK